MELIIFEKEAYYAMQKEMMAMFKRALVEARAEAIRQAGQEDEWIDTTATKKLLGIRSKTKLQQLRDQGEIVFSQHGRIIRYSKNSVLDFLKRHVVK